MSKIPKKPSEIFNEITADYKNIFGDDLISIILYGSSAKGEYQYKKSDINFLIVLTEKGIDDLRKILPLISKWRKRNVDTPLFLTMDYIQSSLDSFPIEFLDMNINYQLVYGEDILKDIEIEEEDLRLQCERELRGKLLHLREEFLNCANDCRAMTRLISQSLVEFTAIFRALLSFKDVNIPQSRKDILMQTAKVFDLDRTVFDELLQIREHRKKINKQGLQALIEKYIFEIKKLTQQVDTL